MKKLLMVSIFGAVALFADPATIIKTKCASCHGMNMEKVALGKSSVVNKMSAAEIEEALKGYKAKTLNKHGLGATMWGQAASMTDDEITEIAKYISSNLNK